MAQSPRTPLTPDRLMGMAHGFWVSQILAAAAHYRYFTLIAAGTCTADAIAKAAGTDAAGTRMVLDSLAAVDVLQKSQDGAYALSPDADAFLVAGRPADISAVVARHPPMLWNEWGRLTEALRERPAKTAEYTDTPEAAAFFAELIRVIVPLAVGPGDAVAEHLGAGAARKGLRVLDVGAGSGAWTFGFARRDPASQITAFDLPHVIGETKKIVAEVGLAARYRMQAGDLTRDGFGAGAYDVAVLGNICHGLTPDQNRDLFARLHRALAPGGTLVVADMIPNEERTGPPFPVLFAVNMYLMTGGDTYTFSQYERWLTEAGFSRPRLFDTQRSHSPMVLADR